MSRSSSPGSTTAASSTSARTRAAPASDCGCGTASPTAIPRAFDRNDFDAPPTAARGRAPALSPEADKPARRSKLADLAVRTSPGREDAAIALHQELLRADHRRDASYRALRELYRRNDRLDEARACDDAMSVLGADVPDRIAELFGDEPKGLGRRTHRIAKPLGDADWIALARFDVDLQLSSLFALVARPFAAERARVRPPEGVPARPRGKPVCGGRRKP